MTNDEKKAAKHSWPGKDWLLLPYRLSAGLGLQVRSASNIEVERMKQYIQDIFDQSMAIESFTHTSSERKIEAFLQERIGEIP